jgi:hypothetical protein
VEAGVSSEFAEALREIRAARESDVVERALSAAREQLGMDAAYIATVDAREQTIEARSGRTNSDVLVVGAVIPVQLSDGSVHGSLCCASNEPRPRLGEPELRFMQVLAGIVAARLERAHGSMVRLAQRFGAALPDA